MVVVIRKRNTEQQQKQETQLVQFEKLCFHHQKWSFCRGKRDIEISKSSMNDVRTTYGALFEFSHALTQQLISIKQCFGWTSDVVIGCKLSGKNWGQLDSESFQTYGRIRHSMVQWWILSFQLLLRFVTKIILPKPIRKMELETEGYTKTAMEISRENIKLRFLMG